MRVGRRSKRGGFSLLELVVVMALLAVLGGLLLPARAAWRDRLARAQAEAELAHLAAGLERYRGEHGDYPWRARGTDDAVLLARALTGEVRPDGRTVARPRAVMDLRGFTFGDPATLERTTAVGLDGGGGDFVILDPWGQPYRYAFRSGREDARWARPGFLLLSTGPSGARLAEEGRREEPFSRREADGTDGASSADRLAADDLSFEP